MNHQHSFSAADGNAAARAANGKNHPLSAIVFYALLLVILLIPIPYGAADPWWEAALESVIFGLAIISFIEFSINPDVKSLPLALAAPLLALIAFAFFQTLLPGHQVESSAGVQIWRAISADPLATRLWALKMSAFMLMGLMLARYTSSVRRLKWLIGVIAIVGVGSALFGIFRQTTQRHDGFLIFNRLTSGLGYAQFINRNQFAYLAEMVLGILLGLLVSRSVKKEKKLVYLAASVILWTAVVLSVSRGGILAMLCQIFFLFVIWATSDVRTNSPDLDSLPGRLRHSRALRVMLAGALLATVLAGTIWMGGDQLSTRLENAPAEMNGSTNRKAAISRLEIWRDTWAMIKDHPLAGVGFGGYWTAIPQYHHGSGEATPQQAHNDYLELLASGGAIGCAIGLWFLVVFLRRAGLIWKTSHGYARAAALGAIVGIFGVAVHSFSDFGLHNATNATVFTALLVIATTRI
jgi:putative inorganic carbon (hco3(-)) transporter